MGLRRRGDTSEAGRALYQPTPGEAGGLSIAKGRILGYFVEPFQSRPAMYITLSKKPRKTNRTKTKRYRAKLKAKDTNRRGRVYQVGKK